MIHHLPGWVIADINIGRFPDYDIGVVTPPFGWRDVDGFSSYDWDGAFCALRGGDGSDGVRIANRDWKL